MSSPKIEYQTRLTRGEITPDLAQARAIAVLDRVFEEVLATQKRRRFFQKPLLPPKGAYIHGDVGRGKSMLMEIFYEALPPEILKKRVHFHAFMTSVHEYIHARRQSAQGLAMDDVLSHFAADLAGKTRVLCFDEFHVTDVADAMILGRLFTLLFARGVVVVATSNWPPERLYEGGLQRDLFLPFIALLKDKMEIVHLESPTDYRAGFVAEEGRYITPLGAQAAAQMNRIFAELTKGAPVAQDMITIKGRDIPVAAVSGGVARFSFAQLCERPHGAEDYRALAVRYHTVLLENIPKLGYDRRNEAKRFMLLIDELYEAGTKLVVSADAPPETLYRGHDHAFEFDRTISRLNEMQSADWWGNPCVM